MMNSVKSSLPLDPVSHDIGLLGGAVGLEVGRSVLRLFSPFPRLTADVCSSDMLVSKLILDVIDVIDVIDAIPFRYI